MDSRSKHAVVLTGDKNERKSKIYAIDMTHMSLHLIGELDEYFRRIHIGDSQFVLQVDNSIKCIEFDELVGYEFYDELKKIKADRSVEA